jgi:hypothetical protein
MNRLSVVILRMLQVAFADRKISDEDHPVIRRLRGQP